MFSPGSGFKVMRIYPNGNLKDNGEGHISFYLKMVDNLDQGIDVTCALKFFIHDQTHNYLVIQDLEEKRFHALKREWGISRILKLSTFRRIPSR